LLVSWITPFATVIALIHIVLEADVDLEKLARRLDVLEPWERAAL
jgi:hypothetical protein